MEDSILISTKKVLGLAEDYTAFDLDIITHINATFSTLRQLGIGPDEGFGIEDSTALWADYDCLARDKHTVKTYVWCCVKLLFDPPSYSFHLTALQEQKREFEVRLNMSREEVLYP